MNNEAVVRFARGLRLHCAAAYYWAANAHAYFGRRPDSIISARSRFILHLGATAFAFEAFEFSRIPNIASMATPQDTNTSASSGSTNDTTSTSLASFAERLSALEKAIVSPNPATTNATTDSGSSTSSQPGMYSHHCLLMLFSRLAKILVFNATQY